MLKRLKNIKIGPLLTHVIISLAYPAAKAAISSYNRLQIFSDSMTIIALLLLLVGVFYGMLLHGDFDVTGYLIKRATEKTPTETYEVYKENKKEKRADSFNYPFFLGVLYLIVSIVIAYVFL